MKADHHQYGNRTQTLNVWTLRIRYFIRGAHYEIPKRRRTVSRTLHQITCHTSP